MAVWVVISNPDRNRQIKKFHKCEAFLLVYLGSIDAHLDIMLGTSSWA
jgi:hypothetical protein